jgi:hypothetical protein
MLEPPIRRDKRGRLIAMRDPLLREMDAMVVSPLAYAGSRPEAEALSLAFDQVGRRRITFRATKSGSSSSARPDCSSACARPERWRLRCPLTDDGLVFPSSKRRAVDRRRLGQLARATLSAAGRRGRSPEGHAPARSARHLREPADLRGCRRGRARAGAWPLARDVPEVLRASVQGVQGPSVVPRGRGDPRGPKAVAAGTVPSRYLGEDDGGVISVCGRSAIAADSREVAESPLPDSNRRPLPYHQKIDVPTGPFGGRQSLKPRDPVDG